MNWTRATLPPVLALLTGCATDTTAIIKSEVKREICQSELAKPITYSYIDDTLDTVIQVQAHNRAYDCLCDNICPFGEP